jgi:hypothetical protein
MRHALCTASEGNSQFIRSPVPWPRYAPRQKGTVSLLAVLCHGHALHRVGREQSVYSQSCAMATLFTVSEGNSQFTRSPVPWPRSSSRQKGTGNLFAVLCHGHAMHHVSEGNSQFTRSPVLWPRYAPRRKGTVSLLAVLCYGRAVHCPRRAVWTEMSVCYTQDGRALVSGEGTVCICLLFPQPNKNCRSGLSLLVKCRAPDTCWELWSIISLISVTAFIPCYRSP